MGSNISKRLERLEIIARKRHLTQLSTMEEIAQAERRWLKLEMRRGGLSDAERAEHKRLQPAWKGARRMAELVLREAKGTPLTCISGNSI